MFQTRSSWPSPEWLTGLASYIQAKSESRGRLEAAIASGAIVLQAKGCSLQLRPTSHSSRHKSNNQVITVGYFPTLVVISLTVHKFRSAMYCAWCEMQRLKTVTWLCRCRIHLSLRCDVLFLLFSSSCCTHHLPQHGIMPNTIKYNHGYVDHTRDEGWEYQNVYFCAGMEPTMPEDELIT